MASLGQPELLGWKFRNFHVEIALFGQSPCNGQSQSKLFFFSFAPSEHQSETRAPIDARRGEHQHHQQHWKDDPRDDGDDDDGDEGGQGRGQGHALWRFGTLWNEEACRPEHQGLLQGPGRRCRGEFAAPAALIRDGGLIPSLSLSLSPTLPLPPCCSRAAAPC